MDITIAEPVKRPARMASVLDGTRSAIRDDPMLVAGVAGVAVLGLLAILAGVIAPYDPLEIHRDARLQPPSLEYLMGTDRYGRDMFSRVLFGTRTSLGTSLLSVSAAALAGTAIGLVSGFHGRRTDQVLMRGMDVLLAFPALLFAITLAASLGPSTMNAALAIAVIYTPVFARVVRGSVLAEVSREYVDASRVMGAKPARTLFVHILPNILTPLTVQFSLALASAVLLESGLSYLGLGTQPPDASWGTLLNEGRVFLTRAPWMSAFPGAVIVIAVFCFFLLGDGLRDRLDPRRPR